MKAKDYTLKALNSIYRSDPWVQQLYNAAGIYADNISDVLDVVFSNYFFDTADLNTVKRFEREMAIIPLSTQSIEERRKIIESKWKANGKASIALLQSVADAWYKDGIVIDFVDGKLLYEVQSGYIMLNLRYIVELLNEKKPAHLGYFFRNIMSAEGTIRVAGVVLCGNTVNIPADLDISIEIDDSVVSAVGFVRLCNLIEIR